MEFNAKLNAALDVLSTTGMWKSSYAPPLYRMLWKLGVHIPPPHFSGFWFNAIFSGLWFGLILGTINWFIFRPMGIGYREPLMNLACAGVFFGFFMALYFADGRRKYRLPRWTRFNPGDNQLQERIE